MLTSKLSLKLQKAHLTKEELHFKGRLEDDIFERPCIAVAGTRKPTPYGEETTVRIVIELVRAGIVIISGLAFGIDSIALKTAVNEGGIAVAVLPSGLEAVYPASNRGLADHVAKSGVLISKYPPHHRPFKHDFLDRNRIIAALSDAVLIPEAAHRSGSLNTARHARGFNIPVYAAPGRIHDHMSSGTNGLIADGQAKLICSSAEIIKNLGLATEPSEDHVHGRLEPDAQLVYKLLQQNTSGLTHLSLHSGLSIDKLLTALTTLEIMGLAKQAGLGTWRSKTLQ